MQDNKTKARKVRRRPPPLRSCVGGCGELGRSWSLHFLCDACRDELPTACFKCGKPLDGRLVCRSCGHKSGSAAEHARPASEPSTAAIPY